MPNHVFETLPQELLDDILCHLTIQQLSPLSQCSRQMQARVEPTLYCQPGKRLKKYSLTVFQRACRLGLDTAVQKFCKYNSSFRWNTGGAEIGDPVIMDDILRHCQPSTLRLLMERGARIEKHCHKLYDAFWWTKAPLQNFKTLAAKDEMMRVVVDMAGHRLCCDQVIVDILLILLIKSRQQPEEGIRYLLGHGANPLRAQWVMDGSSCPLAVAIEKHNIPVRDLLLEHGASIYGKRFTSPPTRNCRIDCIPIFAAARVMPWTDGLHVLECLTRGAEANQHAPIVFRGIRRYPPYGRRKYYTPFPIYVYVLSVKDWADGQEAIQGIQLWLDAGVVLKDGIPVHDNVITKHQHMELRSMLFNLLDRWGLQSLSHQGFYRVIEFLAQFGLPYHEVIMIHAVFWKLPHAATDPIKSKWQHIMEILGYSRAQMTMFSLVSRIDDFRRPTIFTR
ncbi:hypothetical protein B0I35DRAFT_427403 [Stachybotrys elegans]|uniref:F-box domain-containing protein n=1 Tax=Stachybotrys elegans TaxID=80388 RepID=A0A8K0SY85_9HYPO|nr:hypothetical protein B0I35DRAFT_427403 [Stachybotrys elegans]